MNGKLKKALTVLFAGFLAISALIYYVNNCRDILSANGNKEMTCVPEPVSHTNQAHAKQVVWSFDGAFGTFDKQSVQRGYQVYKEVCASCHSLKLVSFRDLQRVGFSSAEVKAIAAEANYKAVNDNGDVVDRPGIPNDKLPAPYANKQAGQAANGGAFPPDLSLMVKARHDGANYIYSLLTGYGKAAPAGVEVPAGKHYNPYFAGGLTAMPQPLQEGQVTYQDGTKATLDQEARDVVNFLQWTAEPEMEERKHIGLKVMLFLAFMTCFFYVAKVRIWARVK